MTLNAFERVRLYLRPPGKGIWTQSTGQGYALRLLNSLYGVDSVKDIQAAWEESLNRIGSVSKLLLGVPSDTGAGILRGANFGPIGIREAYLKKYGAFPRNFVDVGDVICVPQLLHDAMLNVEQIVCSRKELYPGFEEHNLAVSPLSVTEQALLALGELNPKARLLILGGDHSVSWPAISYFNRIFGDNFGILHLDAHSDMWESRLGIKYCFATWAFHAQKLLRPFNFVQVGIRASLRTQQEWESRLPIKQFWAREVLKDPKAVITKIIKHFKDKGVKRLYLTNDIDGTDCSEAPATGTPESGGLFPSFVLELIGQVRQEFEFIGADIVEVAPPLSGLKDFADEKTCRTAAQYLHSVIE